MCHCHIDSKDTAFYFCQKSDPSELVMKWLTFIPICIFTALVVDSIIIQDASQFAIDWLVVIAIVPTLAIALWTKSLAITVVVGVFCMATTRFIFL
ncbi:AzlD domain-containing protein [Litoribacterium kuwaitense]|uniref:AzlD domain-containing protein n=1 Tax=Litoribacterium kuwaitense TaxID=1398745 RepID=UPI0028B0F93E|nr:AzlD domain-containing protein [Litoribacterium kuwaitense]